MARWVVGVEISGWHTYEVDAESKAEAMAIACDMGYEDDFDVIATGAYILDDDEDEDDEGHVKASEVVADENAYI